MTGLASTGLNLLGRGGESNLTVSLPSQRLSDSARTRSGARGTRDPTGLAPFCLQWFNLQVRTSGPQGCVAASEGETAHSNTDDRLPGEASLGVSSLPSPMFAVRGKPCAKLLGACRTCSDHSYVSATLRSHFRDFSLHGSVDRWTLNGCTAVPFVLPRRRPWMIIGRSWTARAPPTVMTTWTTGTATATTTT